MKTENDGVHSGDLAKIVKPLPMASRISEFIVAKDITGLTKLVQGSDPAMVAESLAGLSRTERMFFFKALPGDDTADVFSYLDFDVRKDIVSSFSDQETQKIMSNLSTDDLVDFVDDLPSNLVTKVLASCSAEDRRMVNAFLKYEPDSAGALMTTEYFAFKEGLTCGEALALAKASGPKEETLWTAFVLDATRRLSGTINLDKLIFSRPDTPLVNVMDDDFVSVSVGTDQEVVARTFAKYDLAVLPVVDKEKRMLGIITFDDAMDVVEREATEDVQRSSAVAVTAKPYLRMSIWGLARSYCVWLVALLALNTFTSMVLSRIQANIIFSQILPLLIAFIPTLNGTCGNASDQTSTVVTRELALGNIRPRDYLRVMGRETRAALLTALAVSVFSFGWVLLELYGSILKTDGTLGLLAGDSIDVVYVAIAGLVSLSFVVGVVFAKWLGVTLPIAADVVHIDPATMSQPLISNILDIVAMAVFLGLSMVIILPLAP